MTPFVAVNEKIGVARSPPGEGVEKQIGTFIAENLVDNGATLQMGIGGIPDACLAALKGHKDLGIHSEMFSDGVMELYDSGVITNAKKRHKPGYIVSGTRCTCAVVCSGGLAGYCDWCRRRLHSRVKQVVRVVQRQSVNQSVRYWLG
jgi:hypothetical protein